MFLIKPCNMETFKEALTRLAAYHVVARVRADMAVPDFYKNVYIEVTADEEYFERSIPEHPGVERMDVAGVKTRANLVKYEVQAEFYHCELNFQINFAQGSGWRCDTCQDKFIRTGEGDATCGHLTFTEYTG